MARLNQELKTGRPLIRYGFSVVCVAVALGAALACRRYGFPAMELSLFAMAIVVATWCVGVGPSILAAGLSTASFSYFFAEPIYSFEVSRHELLYFSIFILFAAITAYFAGALRGAIGHFLLLPRLTTLSRSIAHANSLEARCAPRSSHP